jgi:3-deoxy-D-manno-octulosonate 8-phosphate phosphatase (KDO 8-P phosphatase)
MNYKTELHKIKAFIFDVDGVFTDGGMLCLTDGDLLRKHNAKDGYAVRSAVEAGYIVGIISGGRSESITHRMIQLGIKKEDIYIGKHHKITCLEEIQNRYKLTQEQIVYMGDDIPDIGPMRVVGVPCCPSDAAQEVKEISIYISEKKGGEGCVRDIIEQVMKVQGKWYLNPDIVSS